MKADDPRHGSYAGAVAHWRDGSQMCPPCHRAAGRRRKLNRHLLVSGKPGILPATGTVRRIQALMAIGWNAHQIAEAAGIGVEAIRTPQRRRSPGVHRSTFEGIARAYDKLSMTQPTPGHSATYLRNLAAKRGWSPPLAWDDETIDDPKAEPVTAPPSTFIDEVAVQRRISGDKSVRLTMPEQGEAWRRWESSGRGTAEFERITGLSSYRARKRALEAA